jgi:hypothetical protein
VHSGRTCRQLIRRPLGARKAELEGTSEVVTATGRTLRLRSDEGSQGADNRFEITRNQREVVGVDIAAVGLFETGFECRHPGGERVRSHEPGVALHAVGDAVAVLALAGRREFGQRDRKIAEKSPDERADIVLAEDCGELGELIIRWRRARHYGPRRKTKTLRKLLSKILCVVAHRGMRRKLKAKVDGI